MLASDCSVGLALSKCARDLIDPSAIDISTGMGLKIVEIRGSLLKALRPVVSKSHRSISDLHTKCLQTQFLDMVTLIFTGATETRTD